MQQDEKRLEMIKMQWWDLDSLEKSGMNTLGIEFLVTQRAPEINGWSI